MTKAQLRTLLKQTLGNITSTSVTDSWYDDRVLSGYRQLVTFHGPVAGPPPQYRVLRFPSMEDRLSRTIDSSFTENFIPIQATVAVVIDVFDRTNNRALDPMNDTDVRRLDPDEAGTPRLWRFGGKADSLGYYIWPRPTLAAHAISVYEQVIKEPVFTSDGDSPKLPAEWHVAIIYLAAAEGARLLDWSDKAAEMDGQFVSFVATRLSPGERSVIAAKGGSRRNIRIGDYRR